MNLKSPALLAVGGTMPDALISLDRFSSLPTEIIELILLATREAVKDPWSTLNTRYKFPKACSLVCKKWHEIVNNTVHFWTSIHITRTTTVETVHQHILRADDQPLDLWIDSDALQNDPCREALQAELGRWQSWSVEAPGAGMGDIVLWSGAGDIVNWINVELPALRRLYIEGLPLLSTVGSTHLFLLPALETVSFIATMPRWHFPQSQSIRRMTFEGSYMPMRNLLRYLSDCSRSIETLVLRDVTLTHTDSPGVWTDIIRMPRLTELTFEAEGYKNLFYDIATRIQAPRLRYLRYKARKDDNLECPAASFIRGLEWNELEVLDFRDQVMPIPAFASALMGAPALRELTLPKLVSLEAVDEAKQAMMDLCPDTLKVLRVTGIPMSWLRSVAERLPQLEYLDVSGDGGVAGRIASSHPQGVLSEREDLKWLQDHVQRIEGLIWTVSDVKVRP